MIVTCPGCSAKYRVKDAAIPTGGAKMKCPKCGKLFAAHRLDDQDAAEVPQPIAFAAAEPESAASSAHVGQEWDAMMQSEGLVMASRDPFHDAPAAGVAPPAAPSEPAVVGVMQDLQLHGAGASFDASGQAPPQPGTAPIEEVSDPFRNIDIMAPASQPIAGTSQAEESLFGGGEGDAAVRPAAPAPPAPSAPPAQPPTPAVTRSASAKSSAGIRVREPSGELHEFKYLPPARRWVADHPEPQGLEVSIAGAPFANVTLTHAFSDLNFARDQEPESGGSSGAGPQIVQHETFPPPPASASLRAAAAAAAAPSFLTRLAFAISLALLVFSGLYAVWQFELLPLEPHLSRVIVSVTGARSPLVVPELDVEQEAEQALSEAAAARDRGALALAIINYRRVLSFRRNSTEVLRQLADCYQALGDRSAVAELRRVAPEVFATPAAVAPDAKESD